LIYIKSYLLLLSSFESNTWAITILYKRMVISTYAPITGFGENSDGQTRAIIILLFFYRRHDIVTIRTQPVLSGGSWTIWYHYCRFRLGGNNYWYYITTIITGCDNRAYVPSSRADNVTINFTRTLNINRILFSISSDFVPVVNDIIIIICVTISKWLPPTARIT